MFLAGPVLGGIRREIAFFLNRLEAVLLRFGALFQTAQAAGASCRGLSRRLLKKEGLLRKGRRRPEGEGKRVLSSSVDSNKENKPKPHIPKLSSQRNHFNHVRPGSEARKPSHFKPSNRKAGSTSNAPFTEGTLSGFASSPWGDVGSNRQLREPQSPIDKNSIEAREIAASPNARRALLRLRGDLLKSSRLTRAALELKGKTFS